MKRSRRGRPRAAPFVRRATTLPTGAAPFATTAAARTNTTINTKPTSSSSSAASPQGRTTLTDIVQHVFYLVYLCGVPVHYRHVIHLLRRSVEAAEWRAAHRTTKNASTTRKRGNNTTKQRDSKSIAQQWWAWLRQTTQEKVFEAVCARANEVNARIIKAQLNTFYGESVKSDETLMERRLAPLSQVVELALDSESNNSNSSSVNSVVKEEGAVVQDATAPGRMRVIELPARGSAASTTTVTSNKDESGTAMRTYALFQRRYTHEYADVLALKPPPALSVDLSEDTTSEKAAWSAEAAYYAALAQAQALEVASHESSAIVVVADDYDDKSEGEEEHNCALLPASHRVTKAAPHATRETEIVLSTTTATLTTQVIPSSTSPSRCVVEEGRRNIQPAQDDDDVSVVIISGESTSQSDEDVALIT